MSELLLALRSNVIVVAIADELNVAYTDIYSSAAQYVDRVPSDKGMDL